MPRLIFDAFIAGLFLTVGLIALRHLREIAEALTILASPPGA